MKNSDFWVSKSGKGMGQVTEYCVDYFIKKGYKPKVITLKSILVCFLLLLCGGCSCPDWNEYWFDRFEDGQAEKFCIKEGYVSVAGQNPSEIKCSMFNSTTGSFPRGTKIKTFPRPSKFGDIRITLFCRDGGLE